MDDLARARAMLPGHTLALARGDRTLVRDERGIAPMMQLLQEGGSLRGYAAADVVVGKAAAMLFAYAGISAVYADVLSEAAARALRRYGVAYSYRTPAPYIVDRSGTGRCPMETAVLHTEDCAVAYEILKERLAAMRARHK